jgi:hypothetical protein
MKKYILGGVAAVVIAVLTVVNVSLNSQSENLLSDALANVEALAQGEISVGTPCYSWYAHFCIQYWPEPDWELWLNYEPYN